MTDPGLFWALRGGGGNFAAITAMEFELLPITEVYAGALFFPYERAGEVLEVWRRWTATVPDEVTSIGRMIQMPPLPEVPDFLRGQSFAVIEAAFIGSEAQAAELLAPLRELGPEMDTFATIGTPDLLGLHMDPPGPVPGLGDHQMLADLDADSLGVPRRGGRPRFRLAAALVRVPPPRRRARQAGGGQRRARRPERQVHDVRGRDAPGARDGGASAQLLRGGAAGSGGARQRRQLHELRRASGRAGGDLR